MKIDPNDLILFSAIAEEGSFSKAAERLDIPNSTLSRRISLLEIQLGEKLLLRTTRRLTITDFGHLVLAHAHQIADEITAAEELTQHRQATPSGRLRLSMPGDFTSDMLAPTLADFILNYPAITLDIDVSQRRVDLIGENFDLAIRLGHLPDDSTLAARKIATFKFGLYASPQYLKQFGPFYHPDDLSDKKVLHLKARDGESIQWQLIKDKEKWLGLPPAKAFSNSPGILKQLGLKGVGVVCLAQHFVKPQIEEKQLVQLLPDWSLPSMNVWAVFPGRRLMPSRTRLFIDTLINIFKD